MTANDVMFPAPVPLKHLMPHHASNGEDNLGGDKQNHNPLEQLAASVALLVGKFVVDRLKGLQFAQRGALPFI